MSEKLVLHISITDFGGAGGIAYYTHKLTQRIGHQSILYVLKKTRSDETIRETNFFLKIIRKILRLIYKSNLNHSRDYDFKDFYHSKVLINSYMLYKDIGSKPDFIFVYFISSFINDKNLFYLQKYSGAKIFMCLVDMAPLTGGCHFPIHCINYQQGCNDCPGVTNTFHKKTIINNLEYKYEFLTKSKIDFLVASTSIIERFKASIFKNFNYHQILLPLNEEIYKLRDVEFARAKLGIETNQRIIMIGASSISEYRKGFSQILEALYLLRGMTDLRPLILVTGKIDGRLDFPFESIRMGQVNYEKLKLCYNACDFFVSASIDDFGPAMLVEALLCSKPVISFDTGIAKDLIINDFTGKLVEKCDINGLSSTILEFLQIEKTLLVQMGINAKELAQRYYDQKNIEKAFAELLKRT